MLSVANLAEYKDSKSLLSMLVLILRCILYPRAKLFVTSGGKEQSASICKEKVGEWCQFIPALEKEFKKKTETRDYCKYEFKNDSYFDNIPAKESSRGRRRHGGLMEEAAGIDGTILNEVIIPVMNVSRQCLDGTTQEQETLNKSQIYINFFWSNVTKFCIFIFIIQQNIIKGEYKK